MEEVAERGGIAPPYTKLRGRRRKSGGQPWIIIGMDVHMKDSQLCVDARSFPNSDSSLARARTITIVNYRICRIRDA